MRVKRTYAQNGARISPQGGPVRRGSATPFTRDYSQMDISYMHPGGYEEGSRDASGYFMVDGRPMSSKQMVDLLRSQGFSGDNLMKEMRRLNPNLPSGSYYNEETLNKAADVLRMIQNTPEGRQQDIDRLREQQFELRGSPGKTFRFPVQAGSTPPDSVPDPSRNLQNLLMGLREFGGQ